MMENILEELQHLISVLVAVVLGRFSYKLFATKFMYGLFDVLARFTVAAL